MRFKEALLFTLCVSLSFYPLLERFVAPVVALSFGLTALVTVAGLIQRRLRVPASFVFIVWTVMLAIYVVWFGVAVIRDNAFRYITQDSAGFLLYIGVMPILYLLIQQNDMQRAFFCLINRLALAIAILSVALAGGYFLLFGSIDHDQILLTNAFLAGLGLSWKIDGSLGTLGLYTNIAHLMLLGSALALYRFSLTRRRRDLLLVLLYLIALLLDGRRALAITGFLQLMIAAPRLLGALTLTQRIRLIVTAMSLLVFFIFMNIDTIQRRFEFSDADISTAARFEQIPPLLDKITEHPIIGGGFGTYASLLRSDERPFSYEMDFLATIMKLGLIGGALYFGTYLLGVAQALRIRDSLGLYLISAGLPFFFYMGTNGNQAMSTDSAMFSIFLFLMISFACEKRRARAPEPQRLLTPT